MKKLTLPAYERGDMVRILPNPDSPNNEDLVGQIHPVDLALWEGGDSHAYQVIHLVIDGVRIGFLAHNLELVLPRP